MLSDGIPWQVLRAHPEGPIYFTDSTPSNVPGLNKNGLQVLDTLIRTAENALSGRNNRMVVTCHTGPMGSGKSEVLRGLVRHFGQEDVLVGKHQIQVGLSGAYIVTHNGNPKDTPAISYKTLPGLVQELNGQRIIAAEEIEFAPDGQLEEALEIAKKRGVRVVHLSALDTDYLGHDWVTTREACQRSDVSLVTTARCDICTQQLPDEVKQFAPSASLTMRFSLVGGREIPDGEDSPKVVAGLIKGSKSRPGIADSLQKIYRPVCQAHRELLMQGALR